jgi:predicted ATP-dependent serine protease
LCAQEKYDAVFVDSWQKLNADSEEVDKLRADFPRTSFIMISQVTNDGKMRGGQALYHDATAILDIRNIEGKRTCYTVKSRYDNQNKEYKLP